MSYLIAWSVDDGLLSYERESAQAALELVAELLAANHDDVKITDLNADRRVSVEDLRSIVEADRQEGAAPVSQTQS